MKRTKRALSIIITIAMILTSVSLMFSVSAVDGWYNGFVWSLNNGVLTISGNYPIELNEGDHSYPWESYKSSIRSIVIQNGITEIGYAAFADCKNLTSISLPNSLTLIDTASFKGCSSLSTFTIPSSVTVIEGRAFADTAWYTQQPNGVIYIGTILYGYKGNMPYGTTISVKEGTTSIASEVFGQISNLSGISFPSSLKRIGAYAFYNCTGLKNVSIPGSVKYIGVDTFRSCSNLESVILSEGVETLEWRAFANCDKLTSLTIPGSVKDMGFETFEGCDNLKSVTFKSGIIEIAQYAFWDCKNLEEVVMPSTLGTIMPGAFWECASLKKITLPESLSRIGVAAFCECSKLESVEIPANTVLIDYMAFYGCTNMKSFTVKSKNCILNGIFEKAPEDKAGEIRMDYIWDVSDNYRSGDVIFYGYSGSTTESYAQKYNRPFVALEESPATNNGDYLAGLGSFFQNLMSNLQPLMNWIIEAITGLFSGAQTTSPAQGQAVTTQEQTQAGIDLNSILNMMMAGFSTIMQNMIPMIQTLLAQPQA